jgi:solute carrier family 25 carnitine/acylcarnitine transporter 20/29
MQDSQWSPHSFLAGSISGAAGVMVGHPLDTLKTFAQTGRPRPPLAGLFRGIGLQATMAGTIQSANLGVYENTRRALAPGLESQAPLWSHAGAGSAGGLAIACVTAPLSRVKVQQQLTGDGFMTSVRSIRSVHSLYAGVRR